MPNESLTSVWVPVDITDLSLIEDLLRQSDVFTTTFQALGDARYRADTFLREKLSGTRIVLRMDRNLLTSLLALARGEQAEERHRIAAAVQAFAQVVKCEIEPNFALYEVASSADDAQPNDELRDFRRLDVTHPQLFADVAVGRSPGLDCNQLGDPETDPEAEIDFNQRPKIWSACYVASLKIAVLALTPGRADRKLEELLEWMEAEYLFIGPAILLANRFLAPNVPKKRLLKDLWSPDRDRALAGVRNAAWDLAFISQWAREAVQQAETNSLLILASRDRNLHNIARNVVDAGSGADAERRLRGEFVSIWGVVKGEYLLKKYLDCVNRRATANPNARSRALDQGMVSEIRERLEAAVRAYKG